MTSADGAIPLPIAAGAGRKLEDKQGGGITNIHRQIDNAVRHYPSTH
ncbi:MAG: hypothetical protein AB1420_18460 [Bacillota bacterium]